MATDRTVQNDLEATRWREGLELQGLRDMISVYRRGMAELADELAEQRAEAQRLRGALDEARVAQGGELIEVEIDLDEEAQDFVDIILTAELADVRPQTLEDVRLVARELATASANRCTAPGRGVLRVERRPASLRIEIQDCSNDSAVEPLNIVGRLSERWGCEQLSSGSTTMWADLAS